MSTAETPLCKRNYSAAAAANFSCHQLAIGYGCDCGCDCGTAQHVDSVNHLLVCRRRRHFLHVRPGCPPQLPVPVAVTWTSHGWSHHDQCRCWLPAARRYGCHAHDCGNGYGHDYASDFCCGFGYESDSSRCGDGDANDSGCDPCSVSDCDLLTTDDVGEICSVNVIDCRNDKRHKLNKSVTMLSHLSVPTVW